MEFPTKYINPLRKCNKLQSSLDALADIALQAIDKGKIDHLEKFCQTYIRNVGSLTETEGKRLRKVVSSLVFEYGILRNSSVEIQWDIVCVYGPQNYTKVVSYLNSLPQFFHPKMKRLLLVCEPNKLAASVLFNSSFIDIITHDWMVELKKQSPQIYLVAHHYDVDDSTRQLRGLFPQLSINRAQRLLRGSSIEQATQQLLDNEHAGKQPDKKVVEPLQRAATKLSYTPDYEKTLRLANAMLEDELDDEPEDEGDSHIRVFDSQAGVDEQEDKPKQVDGQTEGLDLTTKGAPAETPEKRPSRRQKDKRSIKGRGEATKGTSGTQSTSGTKKGTGGSAKTKSGSTKSNSGSAKGTSGSSDS